MEYKSHFKETPIADIDEKSNTVSVYYAAFNNVDNGGDVILPSAFTKTISERGPAGKDLIYHFKNHKEAISKPKELIVDSFGLKAIVAFPNTTAGRDTVEEYKFGLWKYHSIGYTTILENKSGVNREIVEVKLFEGGHVTWPMNELATTQEVNLKSMEDFIRNSTATDETIKKFMQELQELKSMITKPQSSTLPTDIKNVFANFQL